MTAQQDVYFNAEVSVFKLNDGSELRDLSPYVNELKGLPGEVTMNDKTTFGSVGERPAPSIEANHFTVEFQFNMVTSLGVHTVLGTMWKNKALRAFEYYPAGTTSGNTKFSGSAYLSIYEITSRVKNIITVHAEFHVDNGVTITN